MGNKNTHKCPECGATCNCGGDHEYEECFHCYENEKCFDCDQLCDHCICARCDECKEFLEYCECNHCEDENYE